MVGVSAIGLVTNDLTTDSAKDIRCVRQDSRDIIMGEVIEKTMKDNLFVSPLVERLFSGVTEADIATSLGCREGSAHRSDSLNEESLALTEATALPADPRSAISKAAYDFVVRWETGGKAYYEQVIHGRPIWPGYSSGITIGCGFDLGYHASTDFAAQWQARLASAEFGRLLGTIGFKTVPPDRDAKVVRARQLVTTLSDIEIPWSVAIEQFDAAKLPDIIRQLYRALDNLDRLHPHCRGALLSLVFNRGPSFTADGDRYIEMRRIRALMTEGTITAFRQIPAELRAMKRIWGAQSGLAERREGEAKLFAAGLQEIDLTESLSGFTAPAAAVRSDEELEVKLHEQHEDVEVAQSDDAEPSLDETGDRERLDLDGGIEGALSAASVRWCPNDADQPDYSHLDLAAAGKAFSVAPEDIEALITANEFVPLDGLLILAIRGAGLVAGDQEDAEGLHLIDQRPDHRDFRCVIGVYDPKKRLFSAYRASTVPNADYVFKCFSLAQSGISVANLTGNILPTGCYTYTLGTHKKGQPGEIPGVLRLSTTASGASSVLVQRSLSDLIYDRGDLFAVATPADNIHPGILKNGFSSAGCLTLPGKFAAGRHIGSWKRFREAAGIAGAPDGTQRSALLLTGLDLACAARVRAGVADRSSLRRLRHGSHGNRVKALQAALGLEPDPKGILGPITRKALCERQAAVLGSADGIYAPTMDDALGFHIYGTA
jgi:hypothetical protein